MIPELKKVVSTGCCTGCGACVALAGNSDARMRNTPMGPIPEIPDSACLPGFVTEVCPALGVNYPDLYNWHYGGLPENWLIGNVLKLRTGFAADRGIRQAGASGGVITRTLMYLLSSGKVDAVVAVKQGVPRPDTAAAVVLKSAQDVIGAAQSVYIPVSVLHVLSTLDLSKTYAMTCLPEQSAALRVMQKQGFEPAKRIKYILGPYTGTAIYPEAIRCLLKSHGVKEEDEVECLRWRAGDWPGYLEAIMKSGRIVRSPKVYYNYLIPFFITQTSLQGMDFANEFADLAVGDAWSPEFEEQGGGHSVFVTRTKEMESIVSEMIAKGLLTCREEELVKALGMHGHMIDFKKRGGWLRNQWRRKTRRLAPDYGYRPKNISASRVLVEIVISGLFACGKTRLARWLVSRIPESIMGPLFNRLRLFWKKVSRPTKRKGLANLAVEVTS